MRDCRQEYLQKERKNRKFAKPKRRQERQYPGSTTTAEIQMRFQEIKGHEQTKQRLREMADSGRIPHALLLHGESGLGKMQLARAFAQYIACTDRNDGDSCGHCENCRQISGMNHPDIHYIYPTVKPKGAKSVVSTDWLPEWKRMIRENIWMQPEYWQELMQAGNSQPSIPVSESEELTRIASLSSYSSDYKIFIIWQPEKMNIETANKMLKLLEEPFPDTIFIMVSNHAEMLLPTIYSRMQRIEMKRLSDTEVMELLEGEGFDHDSALHLARLSQGRPGVAESLSGAGSEQKEFSALFRDVMRSAYAMRAVELKRLSELIADMGREKCIRLYGYFGQQTRENFIYNLNCPALNVMSSEEQQFSSRFAPFIHSGNVENIARACEEAQRNIRQNANSKITGFNFLLTLMRELRRPKLP